MTAEFFKMFNAFGPQMIEKSKEKDEKTGLDIIEEMFEESLKEGDPDENL